MSGDEEWVVGGGERDDTQEGGGEVVGGGHDGRFYFRFLLRSSIIFDELTTHNKQTKTRPPLLIKSNQARNKLLISRSSRSLILCYATHQTMTLLIPPMLDPRCNAMAHPASEQDVQVHQHHLPGPALTSNPMFREQQTHYFSPHEDSGSSSLADSIHKQVCSTLSQSRLVSTNSNIRLVRKRDVAHVERVLGKGSFSQVTQVQMHDGSRYACKHLQQELLFCQSEKQFRTAAAELALEAHLMNSFDHPHILKIRGWAYNGVASFQDGQPDSFFLLLDILEETLDKRIERWNLQDQQTALAGSAAPGASSTSFQTTVTSSNSLRHSISPRGSPTLAFQQDFASEEVSFLSSSRYLEKLEILQGISSALEYLHERGVLFRDLKPANIGFLNGKVQLFDFGLARELPALDPTTPFHMSAMVGTLRYMSSEVALGQPYNTSTDIFSWAMVAWEVLNQQKPLDGWSKDMYTEYVCRQGARPDLKDSSKVDFLLEQAWAQVPSQRPTAAQLSEQLLFLHDQEMFRQEQQREQHQRHLILLHEHQQQEQLRSASIAAALKQTQEQEAVAFQQQNHQAMLYFEFNPALLQQDHNQVFKSRKQRPRQHRRGKNLRRMIPPAGADLVEKEDVDDDSSIGTIETTSMSQSTSSFEF